MKTRVDWVDGMAFRATTDSGHAIDIDGPPALGGQERGARPMELLLAGLGSCSAVDVVHILRRGRHVIEGVDENLRFFEHPLCHLL